ncbi:MAG: sodium:solute symporter [Planctomycetota bacterium]|nr:sodium:solute symporter [Planctomycetota bacterium]MDA1106264.1 sodium:solute symporter [Planctomycetota bacterium]
MHLATIDWLIIAGFVTVLVVGALATRAYAQTVAGFLSANRCAGRYLMTVAFNMAQVGVITLVWYFQVGYDVGYTQMWWGYLEGPAMIILAVTGWVMYRFRETRALTLAQFFEMRYSKRFRVFSGIVAFVSGIVNYAIFPGVTARFFMAICGFPEAVSIGGALVPIFPLVMFVLLGLALFMVFAGGQVAVIVTDFLQGVFANTVFVFLCFYLLWRFDWVDLSSTMLAMPQGTSMVNPLGLEAEKNFNVVYWLISAFTLFYACRAWQGDQGYNSAASSPHEARMAQLLAGWRWRVLMLVTIIVPLAVRCFLTSPEHADAAATVHDVLAAQPTDALKAELRTPLALAAMLPAGILGLVVAAMLGAAVSTDNTYLHSWGAIFVQDVVLPLRGKPLSRKAHLLLLKLAILGVAVFAFLFSLLYEPTQYIAMFAALSATVFVGGAGCAIIGGLYWRRGSTQAAWGAMLTGMGLSALAFGVFQLSAERVGEWEASQGWGGALSSLGSAIAWLQANTTGQVLSFFAMAVSIVVYVGVSLFGPRTNANLDEVLHRGKYRPPEAHTEAEPSESPPRRFRALMEKLGFDREYRGWDRPIAYVTVGWPFFFTLLFVVGTAYAYWRTSSGDPISDAAWSDWWHWWTWFVLWVSVGIVAWFSIGGFLDLRKMFRVLRQSRGDDTDDGRVEGE